MRAKAVAVVIGLGAVAGTSGGEFGLTRGVEVSLLVVSAFDELAAIPPLGVWDGVIGRTVDGDRLTLAVVELDPHSVVKEHSHENEQLGIVLRGTVSFRVADETRELGPGDTWRIPANTPHEVHTGPEGAVVIDAFAPPRTDWEAFQKQEPRAPLWP